MEIFEKSNEDLQKELHDLQNKYEALKISFEKEYEELQIAEFELKEYKEKFHSIFQNIQDGFALHEIIVDDDNNPIDYRFLEINPAFEQLTGLKSNEICGKTVKEIMPNIENYWIENYGKVALKGESITFENYVADLSHYYRVTAFSPKIGQFAVIFNDITERKQAEEALQESESRFRDIIFSTSDWIWEIDEQGKYCYCSERIEYILGYKVDEIIGKSPFDFMPERDRERVSELFQKIIENKSPIVDLVNLNIHKDGHEVYLLTNGLPIINEKGNIVGYRGADKDITLRKMAEEALIKSEKRNRTILQTAMDGFWLVDLKGNLLEVNETYCKMSGYNEEELLKMSIPDLEMIEDSNVVENRIQKIINTGEDRFESRHKRKDGSFFFVEISVQYQPDDNGQFVAFIRDITERKQKEIEISKLTKGIEYSPASIVITDKHGIIEYVNPKFTYLTSYTKEEAIGQNPRILKSGNTDPQYYKDLWDKILSGQEWRGELLNKKKNGDLYWESASISPIFNSNNEITHFIAIKEDITERKLLDEELNRLYDELKISSEIIHESLFEKNVLVEELTQSESKLKETIAVKDKFFSIIAHDLRGPFSGFLGLTDLMAKEADDLSVKEIKTMSEAINKSANSVYKLIDDLLKWSRSQTGAMPFFPEKLDLYEIAFNTTFSLYQMASNKKIKIIQNLKPGIFVTGDRNMLTTVVRNLVSNSIKFTEENGIIEIGMLEKEPSDNFLDTEKYILFVKDNGIGIPQKDIHKLFKIDEHYTNSGTNREKGSGLGLILCKDFIERHGGKIWVESDEYKGSTFYFSLKR